MGIFWTLAQMTSVWQIEGIALECVCAQQQGLMKRKTSFRSLQALLSRCILQSNDLCMCGERGHNPLLVPGGESSSRGMQWAGSDKTQMDNCFARKDHMLRQRDGAENKVGGQLEQTDVFIWPGETLEHTEWSRRSAKNSLLWNSRRGCKGEQWLEF